MSWDLATPFVIDLRVSSEDIDGSSRDQRDLTEEILSQAQVMYNIISSTAIKGFKSKVYGQRHISFEIMAHGGLVHYYAVVPVVLVDVIRQAVAAAYPSARLEEVKETNIFNQAGKISGTIGGEFALRKSFVFPIATYSGVEARCLACPVERLVVSCQRGRHWYSVFDSAGQRKLVAGL